MKDTDDGSLLWRRSPTGTGPSHYRDFTITLRHTTLRRTSLEEWSARRRDLYLTTHHNHTTDIHAPGGIRTRIPASLRPQTQVDRAATGWLVFEIYPEWLRKYKKVFSAVDFSSVISHILEDGTVRLSRNVCKELPLFAAYNPDRTAQLSSTFWRRPVR